MRPSHLFEILSKEFSGAAERQHTPVMIWGPPGVGKSQIVMQVGVRYHCPVSDVRLSQMEPSDLRGIPFRCGDVVEWAPPAMLPNAERHGAAGILFLDEITSAAANVSTAAYQLILDRRLGSYAVPDGWAIFAAGNREGDCGITYTMPSPLANRFSHFEIDVHLDDWVVWAFDYGIDERIISFLRFRSGLLFDFDSQQNPVAFPPPRSWEFADRALRKFGDQPAFLLSALQACVGKASGIELPAFIENADKMPDLSAILPGAEVAVPEEIDLQYAIASALVGQMMRVKRQLCGIKACGHILDYAHRFSHKEMAVMMVVDLYRILGQDLFAVPQFVPWADSVSDLMLS